MPGLHSLLGGLLGCGLLLLGGACRCGGPGPADGGSPDAAVDSGPPPCDSREACADGKVCQDGVCEDCLKDRECLGSELCNPVIHRCEFIPCFGGDCLAHADCSLGEFCVQGLCRQPVGDPECGSVQACGNSTDCATDERCNQSTLVCELDTGCFSDAACSSGSYCNLGTNRCQSSCTPETEASICPDSWRCVSGRCVECSSDADCGAGLSCDTLAGRCAGQSTCFTNRDCLRPLVCNRATGQCTSNPPPCLSNEDCLPTEVCDIRSGDCQDAACLPDALEPNDTAAAALAAPALQPGLLSNLSLCNQEEDWMRLTLGAGDRLSLTINPPPLSGSNYTVRVYDPSGTTVLASGNLQIDYKANLAGDVLFVVSSSDLRGDYSVQILISRGVPCEDDAFEQNDALTAASTLAPGQYFNLQHCAGDEDWYELALDRGQQGALELNFDPLGGALELTLFDSDGVTPIGSANSGQSPETLTVSSTSAGRAFLRVRTASTLEGPYDLGWSVQ